jgi:hypothetical protein
MTLLEHLEGVMEEAADYLVTACKEPENESAEGVTIYPIVEIFADPSDREICLIQDSQFTEKHEGLAVREFYQLLKAVVEEHPDYILKVSHHFELSDGEHFARADVSFHSCGLYPEDAVYVLFY